MLIVKKGQAMKVKKKKRAVKPCKGWIFSILRFFLSIFGRIKYNYRYEKPVKTKGPFVVLFNHSFNLDVLMIPLLFKKPMHLLANDVIYRNKFYNSALKTLVSPIPIVKYSLDSTAVKNMAECIKHGEGVALAPSGHVSFDDGELTLPNNIGKLVKMLKAPVYLATIEYGYLTRPRWSRFVRRGKMLGSVKKMISAEELKEMPAEELTKIITETLNVQDYKLQETRTPIKFKGRARAETLEYLLYTCPKCKELQEMHSEKHTYACSNCDYSVNMNEYGYFEGEEVIFKDVTSWSNWQKDILNKQEFKDNETLLYEKEFVTLHKVKKALKPEEVGKGTVLLNTKSIDIHLTSDEHISIKLSDIKAHAISFRRILQLSMLNGEIYNLVFPVAHSAYMWGEYIGKILKGDK